MPQLTIFRIKDGVTDPDKILPERAGFVALKVTVEKTLIGVLYINRSSTRAPKWLGYFGAAINTKGESLSTASVGAVLLLEHSGVMYAITFGHGRHMIDLETIDSRFGLKATLNSVEPSQLRSIDHKRLEAVPRHTREELGRAGGMERFGLDVERDLLRAVTGIPKDGKHGRRLSGADQLTVVGDIPLEKLTEYLGLYEDLAGKTTYRTAFPWVDNVFELTDKKLMRELDERLVKQLKANIGEFWLSPPEMIEWENVASFKFGATKGYQEFEELEWEDYFTEQTSRTDLTVEVLEQDRVICTRADNDAVKKTWSVRRCIIGELTHKGDRFVISEGKWYRVGTSFLADLDQFIAQIDPPSVALPACSHVREGDYNKYAAKQLAGACLLDQDLISFGGRTTIEACDLYSPAKVFVHVKHYGASSKLSHLFSQGLVSAELMLREPVFRQEVQKKLPAKAHWGPSADPISPGDFEISYAVIEKKNTPLKLPLFSKINLRSAVRTLRGLGYRVSYGPIARI